MSVKQVNQEDTNPQYILPIWVAWLVISIIIGAVGGFIMGAAGFFKFNYFFGYVETTPAYYFSLVLFSLVLFLMSGITSIIFIKEMIAESHVRALEIYYGERRKIKAD